MTTSRFTAWTIWFIASIFYAYQYILRVMPNIMLDDIMQQFHISAATFGQFSGVYYIGYSLMHLPVGIMLDRYGPKKIMSACIFISVIGLLPLIFADHWVYPIVGRLLIGIGSSAAILGLFKIIRMAFDEARFARLLSLSVTIGLMGAIYGGGPVSYMHEVWGYQSVIVSFIVIGLILAFVTYWIIPQGESSQPSSVMSDIKEVLSNQKVIYSCLFAGLMVGPLEGFADVWGKAFLKQVYGFDNTLAASLPSMIFIGMCFGAPFLNMIAEKMGSYLGAVVGAGITMILCFSFMLVWQLSPTVLSFNLILIGISCAYQILAIYKASTYVREQVAGLTTAIANMIIMIFGYAFHTTISTIIDAMGGPNTAQALSFGVAVIPIALCLGTCGFLYLLKKERKFEKVAETAI